MNARNNDDSDEFQATQVFDLQDTTSDYFEKSRDLTHSEGSDNRDRSGDADGD